MALAVAEFPTLQKILFDCLASSKTGCCLCLNRIKYAGSKYDPN